MKTPQLSIVVPTHRGGRRLGDLLVSILRQQAVPPFEVIVAANIHDSKAERMVRGLGSRFRYLSTGKTGVNISRNRGLAEARGMVTLFLDDDCFLDEPLLLKRHFDLHQKQPQAIGIGGRYTLKRRATALEQAYHWILDFRLSRAKIDSERTTHLVGGNCSFKTVALRTAFRFNEALVFGGTETDLNARLVLAGQELLLFERLTVEHRIDLSPWSLIHKAFFQGMGQRQIENDGLAPFWKFQGTRQTLTGNMGERGFYPSRGMRFFFSLYDLAFVAGNAFAARISGPSPAPMMRVCFEVTRTIGRRIQSWANSKPTQEINHALRYNVKRRL